MKRKPKKKIKQKLHKRKKKKTSKLRTKGKRSKAQLQAIIDSIRTSTGEKPNPSRGR